MSTTITVDPVTRIEGHARIFIDIDDKGQVERGHLQVLEIRGFEKLLEKMELFRMPQVTARICGVCPAAHHIVSVMAIENGLGLTVPSTATMLRELLYMGHVLHSHALSTFVLLGPDVTLGIGSDPAERNIFGILKAHPDVAKKALRLRSIGQKVVEIVGGRGVHPVAAVPGGMSARPSAEQMGQIAEWGRESMSLVTELAAVVMSKLEDFRDASQSSRLPFHSLAITDRGAFSFLAGDVAVIDQGGSVERRFAPADYATHLVEHVMPGSYMKSVTLRGAPEKEYLVGPLARLNIAKTMSTPRANALLQEYRQRHGVALSPVTYIEARLVELLYCAERMAEISSAPLPDSPTRVAATPKEGRFVAAIEAPRGLLVHDYTADSSGRVLSANLIVATQNNYRAIDASITSLARHYMPQGEATLTNAMEFALRCFDPCLSCATHAAGRMPLEIALRRNGVTLRTIGRR
ncbi:MAG: Ni/Fe hydrogenase subunit alpha [Candidatus Eisenbacteria bacterium]|jgi:F420-non-reducing hydrogenase large subunit|nr:Ni/Fe hydrogenase subunit alpha [Candidatus Eisenbacteria bacterium]